MNKKKKIKKSNQTKVLDMKKIYKASKDMLEKAIGSFTTSQVVGKDMNKEKKYEYKINESYKEEFKVDFSLGRYPIFYKNGEQSYGTFLIGEDGHLYFSDIKNLVSAKNAYKNYKIGSLIFIKHLKNKIFNLLKMRHKNT